MSGTNIAAMSAMITLYTKSLVDFLSERDLVVSPEKSTVTLFTPDTHDFKIHPDVRINGEPVRLEKTPKLLGVVYDTMYTFSHHVTETVKKAKTKVNVLKALAGTSWGQDKETLLMTYKSVCRSTLEYAAPVWSQIISKTKQENLQTVQNQALRVASGCLLMSHQDHLHQETKVLPLKEHSELISKQFLAASYQPTHPANKFLDKPQSKRNRRKTPLTFKEEVSNKFQAGYVYKQTLKSLHTDAVKNCIESYKTNSVLNSKPPEINPEEVKLTRKERSELARLRSGYSRRLNFYLNKIDNQVQDGCPLCKISPHDTEHLFNCAENPTILSVIDLWTNPVKVAKFLKLQDDEV
jgi:hypothetical protein